MTSAETQNAPVHYLSASSRALLGLAFAALLGFLIVAGWSALSTLAELHSREEAVRLNFLSRTEPIVQVRSKLIVYQNLDQKSSDKAVSLISQMQGAIDTYPRARTPQEEDMISKLQSLLANQGSIRVPNHLQAIAATEEITSWNDNHLRNSNAELLAGFNHVRDNLKRLLFILLGCALAIALGSLLLIRAQEKEIRKRYTELAENHDVQAQLSARLLDAQEQERLSISRELHDEVGQSLGALLVDVGRLSTIVPAEAGPVQEVIRKIRLSAETSVSSIRNIALLLRPSMLDDLGLVAAIEWQAREVSRRSDVEVEVEAPEISPELKEEIKICIYRLTQEALNNVARHSGARHAWVVLEKDQRHIGLTVRDDGKGFDPERSRGLGLLGMKERLRLLHGFLTIQSSPGAGTTVAANIPLA